MIHEETPNYRLANLNDAPILHTFAQKMFPDATPSYIPQEAVQTFINEKLSQKIFEEYIRSEHYQVGILEKNKQPVGYTVLYTNTAENPEIVAEAACLSKFYLDPSVRGNGTAQKMMDAVCEQARQAGFTTLWLGTAKLNIRANKFYEKYGFRIVGERKFYLTKDIYGDDVIRRLNL
ncbi:N-acetyltransferase family protein [Rothia sp. P7208]|uniref:GNAT family N-acetyltransferase n=1 Tax=Rothia sp. P7208 TaxID=3402660 RepID=UPI003AD68439